MWSDRSDDVRAAVLPLLPLKGNELVVLAGSLIEGIGNLTSDLDVIVISRDAHSGNSGPQFFACMPKGNTRELYVELTFLSHGSIAAIIEQLHQCHEDAKNTTRIPGRTLTPRIADQIHKIHTGMALTNSHLLPALRAKLCAKRFTYVMYRRVTPNFDMFEDIVGAWWSRDYATCFHNLREFVVTQMIGLSNLHGNTNWKRKWAIHTLTNLGSNYPELANRLQIWLHASRIGTTRMRRAIVEGCEILEHIFAAERVILDRDETFPSTFEVLRAIDNLEQTMTPKTLRTCRELEFLRRVFSGDGPPLRSHLFAGPDCLPRMVA